jgi:hypothetical protein
LWIFRSHPEKNFVISKLLSIFIMVFVVGGYILNLKPTVMADTNSNPNLAKLAITLAVSAASIFLIVWAASKGWKVGQK